MGQEKLTKPNGQAKGNKRAVCTMCSTCDDYESGWCADNCKQYGRRFQAGNENQINVGALRKCLAGSVVPKLCVKQQFRRLEDEEEDEEERELSLAPLDKFSAACQEKLTKPNGQAKGNKRAVCTMCSTCDDYESG